MKNECNIIRDILPLYAEQMVCKDTAEWVETHLKNCPDCQKAYEAMNTPPVFQNTDDTAPLIHLKRKLFVKKIQTIALTALLALAICVAAFAYLDAPMYFPYQPDLLTLIKNSDGSITVTFDESVTDFRISRRSLTDESDVSQPDCFQIEAWTSTWDQWFARRGPLSVNLTSENAQPITLFYVSNNGQDDICLYGSGIVDGGVISLPRLTLGYFLSLAIVSGALLFILRWIFFRCPGIQLWIDRIMMYPLAYIIAHLLVMCKGTLTYSITRDFCLIALISILLYACLLLAHSHFRLHREIKSMTTTHYSRP